MITITHQRDGAHKGDPESYLFQWAIGCRNNWASYVPVSHIRKREQGGVEVPVFWPLILPMRTPALNESHPIFAHDEKLQGGICNEQHRLHASSQSTQHCNGLPELPEYSWPRTLVRKLRPERAVCVRYPLRAAQATAWRRIDLALARSDVERYGAFAVISEQVRSQSEPSPAEGSSESAIRPKDAESRPQATWQRLGGFRSERSLESEAIPSLGRFCEYPRDQRRPG